MSHTPSRLRRLAPIVATAMAVVVGAVVFAFSDPNRDTQRTPPGIAAIVGDEQITDAQLDRALTQARAQITLGGNTPPADEDLRREVIQAMVMRLIYAAEAKACGTPCRVTSRDVDRELERVLRANFAGEEGDFAAFLERAGMTRADARAQIREALIGRALDTHHGGPRTRTLKDARAYYNDNPEVFRQPASRRVSHILVDTRAEAAALAARLDAGASFADLARRHSTDTASAVSGGALGTLEDGSFVEDFTNAAKALGDGEVSGPVKTQFGWHLIHVQDVPAHRTRFADVGKDLVRHLRDQEVAERLRVWSTDLNARWRPRLAFADPTHDPYNPASARAAQAAQERAERATSAPDAPTPGAP